MIIQNYILARILARESSFLFQLKTLYFHQSDFYLERILLINPASIYTVFFSLIQFSLIEILSSLQLPFI